MALDDAPAGRSDEVECAAERHGHESLPAVALVDLDARDPAVLFTWTSGATWLPMATDEAWTWTSSAKRARDCATGASKSVPAMRPRRHASWTSASASEVTRGGSPAVADPRWIPSASKCSAQGQAFGVVAVVADASWARG